MRPSRSSTRLAVPAFPDTYHPGYHQHGEPRRLPFAARCSLARRTRHLWGGRLGGRLSRLVPLHGFRVRGRRRGRRSEAPAPRRRRSRGVDDLRDGSAVPRRQGCRARDVGERSDVGTRGPRGDRAPIPGRDAWLGLRGEPWSWRSDPPTDRVGTGLGSGGGATRDGRPGDVAAHSRGVHGAQTIQQCLDAGLLDEVHVDLAAVLLGAGVRLFDHLANTPVVLGDPKVIAGVGVTHLRYPVHTS